MSEQRTPERPPDEFTSQKLHDLAVLAADLEARAVAAEQREHTLREALAQACTNLATFRGSKTEGRTVGDDADAWQAALLSGWGAPDWTDREWLAALDSAVAREETTG